MSFNISGIAINKSYKNNLDELFKEFKWKAVFQKEVTFETASENWKEEGIFDVYFTEKGTLIFMDFAHSIDPWIIEGQNTLTFVLSETSMTFGLNYCEGKRLVRSFTEIDEEYLSAEGEALEVEENAEDSSEIILDQLELVIGKSFWDIDLEETAFRYTFQ